MQALCCASKPNPVQEACPSGSVGNPPAWHVTGRRAKQQGNEDTVKLVYKDHPRDQQNKPIDVSLVLFDCKYYFARAKNLKSTSEWKRQWLPR